MHGLSGRLLHFQDLLPGVSRANLIPPGLDVELICDKIPITSSKQLVSIGIVVYIYKGKLIAAHVLLLRENTIEYLQLFSQRALVVLDQLGVGRFPTPSVGGLVAAQLRCLMENLRAKELLHDYPYGVDIEVVLFDAGPLLE